MALGAFFTGCSGEKNQADNQNPQSRMDSISYIVGTNLAYQSVGVDLNPQMILQGFKDVKDSADLLISQEQSIALMGEFQRQLASEQMARLEQEAVTNDIRGRKYLEQNREKEGFVETASGLQYKILEEGKGESPDPDDIVQTRFTGKTIDGMIFDTTEGSGPNSGPRRFEVSKVIEGWREALLLMKPGAHWEVVIPAELGYGKELRDPIPPNSVLIFDLTLLEVENQ